MDRATVALRIGGLALWIGFSAGPALIVGSEAAAFVAGTSLVPHIEARGVSLCHHLPERTPTIGGRLLPVCARCTGVYLGGVAGGLGGLLVPRRPAAVRRAGQVALGSVAIGLLAAFAEALGAIATSNAVRVVLGGLLGAPIPLVAVLGGRLMARISGGR